MKNNKMSAQGGSALGGKNQKVGTGLGTIVLVIIAITVGVFVWQVVKNREVRDVPQDIVNVKKPVAIKTPETNQQDQTKTSEITLKDKASNATAEVTQPKMPTAADEAGKSSNQMVKDFYDWYIANTNYQIYQIEQLKETKNPIIPKDLTLKSPFISSTYEQNMNKTSGGDPILCNQDNNNNVFRGYEDEVISGDSAKMYALIGLSSGSEENYKMQVILKKEKKQWKIDEINCSQFRL